MEVQKISAGTIARLVLLLLALVNSALTAAGKSPIPIDEEGVQQFITLAFLGNPYITTSNSHRSKQG
ncbi:hypothetical protein BSAF29S_04933 [Bacillus safensis subsp. safensis]